MARLEQSVFIINVYVRDSGMGLDTNVWGIAGIWHTCWGMLAAVVV